MLPGSMMRGLLYTCLNIVVIVVLAGSVTVHAIKFQVTEEMSSGTFVGNVFEDAGLASLYGPAILPVLRYSILSKPNAGTGRYFKIHAKTGVVRTAMKLDRDSICRTKQKCVLNVDVAVSPAEYFKVIAVEIEVLDVNDNSPKFPQSSMTCVIPESSLPGATFTLLSASDPDSAANGIQGYDLLTDLTIFGLKVLKNLDGSTDVRLVLNEQLDRETKDSYSVTVVARDGGQPSLTGSLLVNISIGDTNDNHPEFRNASYHVYVFENSTTDSVILQVEAFDSDIGENGKLTYGLTARTKQNYGDVFGMSSSTGEIFVRASRLDYEVDTLYQLVVYARDMGAVSHSAYCVVIVHVVDINDNAPSVTINTLTPDGVATVSEEAKGNTFIAHVSAVDLDNGKNGELSCSVDTDKFVLEKLQKTQFKIVTSPLSNLDRERTDRYVVTLTCVDRGRPALSTSQKLTIIVTDWNDEVPRFTQMEYHATIEENNDKDTVVIRVLAIDGDLGNNGKVEYKLGSEQDTFYINAITGTVYAAVPLDYETVREVSFTVIAYDLGDQPLSSTATVVVTVTDVNDKPPVFPQSFYSFGTFENQAVGTEIGNILAVDGDSLANGVVEYTLVAADLETLGSFAIDVRTGQIRNRRVLDREYRSVYHLTAVATDKERPSLRSSANLTIYVVDENDNAPVFVFPNLTADNNTVRVSNQIPRGHAIAQVSATDADNGQNAQLRYMLLNYRNTFNIDALTGVVSVAKKLESIRKKTYNVIVLARDKGTPPRNSTATLEVIVDKSVVYLATGNKIPGHASKRSLSSNLTTVAAVGGASLVVIIILVVAIIIIKCSDRHQGREPVSVYQTEAQIMLNASSSETRSRSVLSSDKDSIGSTNSCDKMVDETTMDRQRKTVRPSADGCSDDAKCGSRLSWTSLVRQQHAEQVCETDDGKTTNLVPLHLLQDSHPVLHSPIAENVVLVGKPQLHRGCPNRINTNPASQCHSQTMVPSDMVHPVWQLEEPEAELWRYLKGDEAGGCRVSFTSSSSSEEMSNTDSGRGPSEEGVPSDGVHGSNKGRHDRSNCSFNSFRPMSPAVHAANGNKKLHFQTVGVPRGVNNANRTNQPNCQGCLPPAPPTRCLAPNGMHQHPQYTVNVAPDCLASPNGYSIVGGGQNYYFQKPPQNTRPTRRGQPSNSYLDVSTGANVDHNNGGVVVGRKCNFHSPPPLEESGSEDVTLEDNVSSTTSGSYMVDHTDVDEPTTKDFPAMNATM